MWRVATSERFAVSPREIFETWTMGDVERANLALDVLEDAEHLLTPTQKT